MNGKERQGIVDEVTILHQDGHLIVASKPSGLLYHRSGISRDRVFLLQTVRNKSGGVHVYPLQRLDRATSGVTVLARTPESARWLQDELQAGHFRKIYLALVHGVAPASGIIAHPLTDKATGRRREALTRFLLLAAGEDCALLAVEPLSGRRHQIRRHLRKIHHPILGDTLYTGGKINRAWRERGLHRLALHAWLLEFPHPRDGVRRLFQAGFPDDLAEVLAGIDGISERLTGLFDAKQVAQPLRTSAFPDPGDSIPADAWADPRSIISE